MSQTELDYKTNVLNEIIMYKIQDKTRFLIIDGFDGEGKTTFSKQLADKLKMKYLHYPMYNKKYDSVWYYLAEMLSTVDIVPNAVVDRYVFSTIAYNDIHSHEWPVEYLLKYVRDNGLVVMSEPFYELVKFKLSYNQMLSDLLKELNMIIVKPWLMMKPNFEETIKHMSDPSSIDWIKTHGGEQR